MKTTLPVHSLPKTSRGPGREYSVSDGPRGVCPTDVSRHPFEHVNFRHTPGRCPYILQVLSSFKYTQEPSPRLFNLYCRFMQKAFFSLHALLSTLQKTPASYWPEAYSGGNKLTSHSRQHIALHSRTTSRQGPLKTSFRDFASSVCLFMSASVHTMLLFKSPLH